MQKNSLTYVFVLCLVTLPIKAFALSCPNLPIKTQIGELATFDKTKIISNCTDQSGPVTVLMIDSPGVKGGFISDDGVTYTYYPPATDFSGFDKFIITLADDLDTVKGTVTIFVDSGKRGNFTALQLEGKPFKGTNDVIFDWDQSTFNTDESDTNFGLISISSETLFFDKKWTAHHIRIYDGGVNGRTLSFDTTCSIADLETGTADCGGTPDNIMTLKIPAGMYGAHILFDWDGNTNIDIVNVWEPDGIWDDTGGIDGTNDLWLGPNGISPNPLTSWELVSKDINGDGINGYPIIEDPFKNSYFNFSWNPAIIEDCERFDLKTDVNTGQCIDDSEIDSAAASIDYMYLILSVLVLLGRRNRHTISSQGIS